MESFLPMLGLGLVTSVHCVFMCGAMVVTYAVKDRTASSVADRLKPHAVYQTAKVASYVVVGLALGAIGAAFDITGLRGWVMLGAGLFMVILGLNMTGSFPLLRRLTVGPPKFLTDAIMRNRRKAMRETKSGAVSIATPVTFGLLTGLMPCAPLQAAQLAAAGSGSAVQGATAMLGFGLGTAPLMVVMGVGSGYLGSTFKRRMTVVAAMVVIVLGLVMFDRGSMLVGSPLTFQSAKYAVLGGPDAGPAKYTIAEDGIAEVPLVVENIRFVPEVVQIPADQPVRLMVERREDNACSDQIAVPQLGVLEDLRPFDTTTIELPAAPRGSYTLTCGMGMMSGQLVAGVAEPGVTGDRALGLGIGAVFLGLAGYAVISRRRSRRGGSCPAGTSSGPAGDARILGLTYAELALTVAAVIAAVIAGYLLGGMAK